MPNTETNKKHDEIVECLKQELINTGNFDGFIINKKSGYDIKCVEKKSQRVLYFAALLYGNRLYDATTLEEWEIAMNNETSFYFVAALAQEGKLKFFYFSPLVFMLTCSIPKFKIRSSLKKKDIPQYKTINDILESSESKGVISPTKRRVAIQLKRQTLEALSVFWKKLTQKRDNHY